MFLSYAVHIVCVSLSLRKYTVVVRVDIHAERLTCNDNISTFLLFLQVLRKKLHRPQAKRHSHP